jgi:putative peptidoglycan lipid II flippase
MPQDNPQLISKSAWHFLSGTFLSRLSGLGRDVSMAFCFGSNPAIAAFLVAFRFANLLRRLFGEGQLSSGFIPYFEALRGESHQKGACFFRDLFHSLSFFLIILISMIEVGLFCLVKWGGLNEGAVQIIYLIMLMLPGGLFICLFGLSSALLQCENRFFLPAFAPLMFNLTWIVAVWCLRNQNTEDAMMHLAGIIVIAFLFQWLTIFPRTLSFLRISLSLKECFKAKLFSMEIRRIIVPVFFGVIGVGAVQVNSALDGIFARFACLEGPAYLWYAIRIEQLPLALFGIALSSALLPPLSRAMKDNDMQRYHSLLDFSLVRSFSLIFPSMIALVVLGSPIVNLIYGRGDFDSNSTLNTILCLWGYSLGLLPSVFVILFAPAFYAQKDYRTPMIAACASVLINFALNALMVFGLNWGAFSIAIATSVAAFFNFYYLSFRLSIKIGSIFTKNVLKSFSKTVICSLISGAMTLILGHFLIGDSSLKICLNDPSYIFPRQFSFQALHFFVLGGFYLLILLSYAWMMNAEDILQILGLRKKVEFLG